MGQKSKTHIVKRILGNQYAPVSRYVRTIYVLLFPISYGKFVFKKIVNRRLNLRDPKDFFEKIQWLKIYSDTSLWTPLADKYKVRDYVTHCGLEHILVRLYGVWERAEDIDFSGLPDKFVLKTNHGFGKVILVEDKSKLDIGKTRFYLNQWLAEKYGLLSFEPHYLNIERRIIAEEILQDKSIADISVSVVDYKFHCLNGEPDIILAMYNRQNMINGSDSEKEKSEIKACAFDTDWNPRPDVMTDRFCHDQPERIPRPSHLDEMKRICRILSKPFAIVRVDLYEVNGKVYFGELTFTPGGGMGFFTADQYLRMGNKVDLSKIKKRRHLFT